MPTEANTRTTLRDVPLGAGHVTIEDVVDISRGRATPTIDTDEEVRS
ncbi:MAG: hypothetical protein JRH11_18545, partial [Deltaproteobacteria bacterium]|nr:hypothetical protein [Deltaproteobacteria bacterium]